VVALVEVLVQQGRVKDAMRKGGPDPTDHGAHADLEDPDEHIVSLCRDDGIASNLANPGERKQKEQNEYKERQESKPGDGALSALLTR
jgi:hypothetical protein